MTALLLATLLLTSSTAPVSTPWEGWEPKTSLPTQAHATLENQAVYPEPEPAPEPAPEPESFVPGVEQWRPLVAAYPDWNVDVMLDIMWCESRGIPTAENPYSTATGLFQIMWSIWYADLGPRADLHDPWLNVEIARQVWGVQGYGAWVCWN